MALKYTAYTKLMEDYQVPFDSDQANAFTMMNSAALTLSAALDAHREPFLVISHEDGAMGCFRLDKTGCTDFTYSKLDMTGWCPEIIKGPSNALVLFVIRSGAVYYRIETAPGSGVFGSEMQILMGENAGEARQVMVKCVGDKLTIAVLLSDGVSYRVNAGIWSEGEIALTNIWKGPSFNCMTWAGDTLDSLTLTVVVGSIAIEYNTFNGCRRKLSVGNRLITQLCWLPWLDSDGFYLGLSDGELVRLIRQADDFRLETLSVLPDVCATSPCLAACSVKNGKDQRAHIMLTGSWNYHICLEQQEGGALQCYSPMPVEESGSYAVVISGIVSRMEAYVLRPSKGDLVQLCCSYTGDYSRKSLPLPGGSLNAAVRKTACFSTELTLMDHNDFPIPDMPVKLWARDTVYIKLPTGTIRLGPHTLVEMNTGLNGALQLIQEADSFTSTVLCVNAPSMMDPDEVLLIRQSRPAYSGLESATPEQLVLATKSDGSFLLPEQYRTETQAKMLLDPVQAILKEIPLDSKPIRQAGTELLRIPSIHNAGHTGCLGLETAIGSGLISDPECLLPQSVSSAAFHLSFDKEGYISYEELTVAEAQLRMMSLKANGTFTLRTSIGDFYRSVKKGCVVISDLLVAGCDTLVRVTIRGVEYLLAATARTIRDALNLVCSIFERVKVSFQSLFEWIGFILDWDDILRTQRAVKLLLNEGMAYMSWQAEAASAKVDNVIMEIKETSHEALMKVKTEFLGESSLCVYARKNAPEHEELSLAMSNNYIAQKYNVEMMKTNAQQAIIPDGLSDFGPMDAFFAALKSGNEALQERIEIQNLMCEIKDSYGTSDGIAGAIFSRLIDLVDAGISFALDGAAELAKQAFSLAEYVLQYMQLYLTANIYLSFITRFFSLISGGQPLTVENLITLLIAIPATIVYKLEFKQTMFASDTDVYLFEQEMKRRFSGVVAVSDAEKETVNKVCKSIGAVSGGLFYVSSFYMDLPLELDNNWTAFGMLALEAIMTVTDIPAIYGNDYSQYEMLHGCFGGVCLVVDIICTLVQRKYTDKGIVGIGATFCLGLIDWAISTVYILNEKPKISSLKKGTLLLVCVSETIKPLVLEKQVLWAGPAMADALCGLFVPIDGLLDTI